MNSDRAVFDLRSERHVHARKTTIRQLPALKMQLARDSKTRGGRFAVLWLLSTCRYPTSLFVHVFISCQYSQHIENSQLRCSIDSNM